MTEDEEVAIFWDYENVKVVAEGINVPLAESLIEYSESIGHPRVKKVYSNWVGIHNVIIKALYSLGFEPIQVSMGKTNSVDLKIAVDCLDTAISNPLIKYFIIVTGDKDFIPVVNWLKANRREVTIIGKLEISSEHLILSANKFVSLEELSKMFDCSTKAIKIKAKAMPFKEAVKCLIKTITKAREQGRSTRFASIDILMRSSKDFDYNGAMFVKDPSSSNNFPSFGSFLTAAEETGKIKMEIIEGFKEIFLKEEDPEVESEFSPALLDTIQNEHWKKFFDLLMNTFFSTEKNYNFADLHNVLRLVKKEENLPYSNNTLKSALFKIIETGFLVKKDIYNWDLVEDHQSNLDAYLKKIKQDS